MGNAGKGPGYQPLGWLDHLKMRAAMKHLHSRFHNVRVAAHKEIQAILHRKRGVQNRLREWLRSTRNAAVRKVTPRQLHGPLRIAAAAPQAPRRGQATPLAPTRPRGGFTPPHGFGQTAADLKERARAGAGQPQRGAPPAAGLEHDLAGVQLRTVQNLRREQDGGARAQRSQPSRQPDAMQQATETMRRAHQQEARSAGRPGHASPAAEHTPAPSRGARAIADIRERHRAARAARRGLRAKGGSWRGLDGRTSTPAPAAAPQVFDRLPSGYAPTPPSPARNRTA
jgi:hypothetical protein